MRLILFLLACTLLSAQEKTWVLSIGISQYQKLPHDLWLQYADADARSFAQQLAAPAAQTLLLTNEQATTDAVRKALGTFLKGGPGLNDTVYILIAGHGTVDADGAWILTYDGQLPMAELHAVVEQELTRAKRVIFLADVCRAGAIASLGVSLEKIGEAPGEMLGLMAARPKELSLEAPDFGGGHGAFTYSVLKALKGAADRDHDGFVTAGELIDFVNADVPALTANKQHPRDFGNMDNATRLSKVP